MRNATQLLAAMLVVGTRLTARGTPPPASQPALDYQSEFTRSEQYVGPRSQEHLDLISKKLEAPETRMAALRELIDFAGWSMYDVGSFSIDYGDGSEDLRNQAAKATDAAADDATVQKALASPDPLLVFWGIRHVRNLKNAQAALPTLENIAKGKDESLRCSAVEALKTRGDRAFVQQLAQTEKSPYVLDQILFQGNPRGANSFNERLCEILKDFDPNARKEVVDYLGGNWISAAARQCFIDASLMDGLLACAQAGGPEAGSALEAFRTCANHSALPDAAAAAKWWKRHRSDWESARFPRWEQPNGSPIFAAIVTTGQVGGAPGWQASIILENRGKEDVYVNLAEVGSLHWILYERNGQQVPVEAKRNKALPHWLDMQPGRSVTEVSPIVLKAGESLKPGRYTLQTWMNLGVDRRGFPEDMPLRSGEIPLPAIIVEVAGGQVRNR